VILTEDLLSIEVTSDETKEDETFQKALPDAVQGFQTSWWDWLKENRFSTCTHGWLGASLILITS
jgi:hypothetical protein